MLLLLFYAFAYGDYAVIPTRFLVNIVSFMPINGDNMVVPSNVLSSSQEYSSFFMVLSLS